MTYDALGRVATATDGKSQTRTFSYDKLDRLLKVEWSSSNKVAYVYDEDGNATSRADTTSSGTQTTAYENDKLGRLTKQTFPGAKINDFTYDLAGNLATLADAGGTTTYRYDPANRLKDLAEPTGSCSATTPTLCTKFDFTDRSAPKQVIFPNGTQIDRTFNADDNVTRITLKKGATVLKDLAYEYTDRSASARKTELRQAASDLVAHRKTFYVNDGSTTTTTSYAYNQTNQLCWRLVGSSANACGSPPTGATSYAYDANGNQTTPGSGAYNTRDQTTSINSTALTYFGVDQVELIGDGSSTMHNNPLGVGAKTTGSTTTYYTRDPGGQPVAQRAGSTRHYYTPDALGSTIALTDSSGNIAQSYSYEPYGKLTNTPTIDNPFRYAAGHQTNAAGLYHFGARLYDTTTGRWTQPDPLNQPADLREANRYSYVGNDPANATDPTDLLFGINVKRAVITGLDVGFTGISAASSAATCVASSGVACGAAFVASAVASRYLYSSGVFKGSYLRDENGE